MEYGYCRVSSKDQNEDRQMLALKQLNISKRNTFVDKVSGKDFNRPAYNAMMKKLKENDVLFILSIDRLGRNYEEILEQWRVLTKIKKVDIVVIDMPLLDTRRGKDLMGTFLSDVVLQILSFVAENERKNIKERQREGIKAAKLRGVRFGRPSIILPENFEKTADSYLDGNITLLEGSTICNMTLSTFYRKLKEYRKKSPRE